MAEQETVAEWQARMRSLSVIKGGRTKPLEKVITRPEYDASGNQIDAGRKAKVTINEERNLIYTTSDNRQDANIIGEAAITGARGEEG